MITFNRYLRVYIAFLKINAKRVAAYRMDTFVSSILASTVWSFFQITAYYLLTLRIDSAFGWTRTELLILSCTYSLGVGFFSLFFMRAFSEMPMIVNRGWLDMYLLKPIDSQFTMTNQSISLTSSIRIALGIIIVAVAVLALGVTVTMGNILLSLVLLVFGGLLLYSALYILNTLLIWFPQLDNVTDLFYTLRAMGRFPGGMYRASSELFFLLLAPFILPVSIPTRAFLGTITTGEAIHLITLSIALFIASRMFWKFALRSYTSASG